MNNGTFSKRFLIAPDPTDKTTSFSRIVSRFHGLVETRVIRQHCALLFEAKAPPQKLITLFFLVLSPFSLNSLKKDLP